MKRWIGFALIFAALMTLAACGRDDIEETTASTEPSQTEQESWYDSSATLEETVILSGDISGVRIVAVGMEYGSPYGMRVKLAVENNANRDIELKLGNEELSNTLVVNGIMVPCADLQTVVQKEGAFYPVTAGNKISAGETVDAIIYFTDELWLRDHGITKIASLQYDLRVLDLATGELCTEASGILRTSDCAENMPAATVEGATAYEQDGLKVVDMGLKDCYYNYCIVNNTESYLWVELYDVVMNGQPIGWGSYFDDFYVYENSNCFENVECTGWEGLENVTADSDIRSLEYKLRIWSVPASGEEYEIVWESGAIAASLN